MGLKQFTSPRFKWLVANAPTDPKLQKLLDDLGTAWDRYMALSIQLNYLYPDKPKEIPEELSWTA